MIYNPDAHHSTSAIDTISAASITSTSVAVGSLSAGDDFTGGSRMAVHCNGVSVDE